MLQTGKTPGKGETHGQNPRSVRGAARTKPNPLLVGDKRSESVNRKHPGSVQPRGCPKRLATASIV